MDLASSFAPISKCAWASAHGPILKWTPRSADRRPHRSPSDSSSCGCALRVPDSERRAPAGREQAALQQPHLARLA
eukprot:366573-Chlamydomonas_euryale.AAC.25